MLVGRIYIHKWPWRSGIQQGLKSWKIQIRGPIPAKNRLLVPMQSSIAKKCCHMTKLRNLPIPTKNHLSVFMQSSIAEKMSHDQIKKLASVKSVIPFKKFFLAKSILPKDISFYCWVFTIVKK